MTRSSALGVGSCEGGSSELKGFWSTPVPKRWMWTQLSLQLRQPRLSLEPGVDLCWNMLDRLPFRSGELEAIFCEHALEHVSLEEGIVALQEFGAYFDPTASRVSSCRTWASTSMPTSNTGSVSRLQSQTCRARFPRG